MYLLINHNNVIEFDEGSWLQNLIFEFSGRYVNKEKLPENEAEFVDEVCDMLSEQEKQAYLLFSGYRGKASTYKEIAEELNVTFKEAKQLVAHAKTQLSWKANLIEDKLFRISPAAIKSNDLMFIQQLYDFLTGNLLTSYNDVFEHLLNNGVYISSDLSRMIAEEISDFWISYKFITDTETDGTRF